MLKITLAIIVVLLLGYLGYGLEKYYKIRLKILNDYNAFLTYVSKETDFYKTDILNLIKNYDYQSNQLKELLLNVLNKSKNENIFLTKEIIDKINNFINELSIADYYFKNTIIKNAREQASQMILNAEKDKSQKGELGRKMLILLGIGLIVLII